MIRIGNTGNTGGVFLPVKDYGYPSQSGTLASTDSFYPVMYNFSTGELLLRPRIISITSIAMWNNFFATTTNKFGGLIIEYNSTVNSSIYLPPLSSMNPYDSFEVYNVGPQAATLFVSNSNTTAVIYTGSGINSFLMYDNGVDVQIGFV